MKKAKYILGAILIAGVAYAAGQNFKVMVNGQTSDIPGVVVNNRLYVPVDVLPDLGIRVVAAPGVIKLSSGNSSSSGTNSSVVTGGGGSGSSDYKDQAFKNGNLAVTLNRCYRNVGTEVICDFSTINNGSDGGYKIYANNGEPYICRFVLEDGTEIIATGAKANSEKSWQNIFEKTYRSQIKYTIQIRFDVPSYISDVKYFDVSISASSYNASRYRINDVTIE
jgi:hypothetical protein